VTSDRSRRVVDGLGVALLAAYIGTAFVAAGSNGNAWPLVVLLLASFVVLVLARVIGSVHRAIVPAALVAVAIFIALAVGGAVVGAPLGGPFRYRNATGAFFVQASVAALMVAGAVRRWPVRIVGILVAIPFAAAAVADSAAAGIGLLAVGVGLLGSAGGRAARISVVLAGVIVALVLAGSIAMGAGYHVGSDGPVVRALTERRLVLWHESLQIMRDHPGGVGPGRFADVSPTAIADQDAHWAHNEFLQEGVELGWAGVALMVLVFIWGFARLWLHPDPDVVVAVGAAALAALGIHACVDYVLHFPAVPLAAAALVGTAQASPTRRFRRAGDELGQESVEDRGHPAGVTRASTPG